MIKEIDSNIFEEEIKLAANPVSVFFWVRSCDGCRKFKPVYEELPTLFPDVTFVTMGMMKSIENLRLAESLGVEETPTTIIFCDGEKAGTVTGYMSPEKVGREIRKIIEKC